MNKLFFMLLLSATAVIAAPESSQTDPQSKYEKDLLSKINTKSDKPFGERKGTYYIVKEYSFHSEHGGVFSTSTTTSTIDTYDNERANRRFSPCSTFKIPNTLIALEEGILTSETIVKWDKDKHIIDPTMSKELQKKWSQDMDLKYAFANSCVWFYKEIAKQVPPTQMKKYLKEFKYGNEDHSATEKPFWISSSLKISAKEQVEFLQNLYHRKLNLKENTYDQAEKIFKIEDTPTYTLYAKTGSGINPDNTARGWYVGYVVRKNKKQSKAKTVYYFAINMDGKDFNDIVENRLIIARQILKDRNIID